MALLAVTSTKIFRSAIWLLFSLIGIAGLYFWMEMEFIAAVQIIVYVGGIVVLIIFSIFLTQQAAEDMPTPSLGRKIAAALAVLFGIGFTGSLIYNHGFQPSTMAFDNEVGRIGRAMLYPGDGGFLLPFEAVSLLLLAAMVGCIVIAMRSKDKAEGEDKVKVEAKAEIEAEV
jgi:NADH-quinone oxidoreductase subunit J